MELDQVNCVTFEPLCAWPESEIRTGYTNYAAELWNRINDELKSEPSVVVFIIRKKMFYLIRLLANLNDPLFNFVCLLFGILLVD